MCYYFPDNLGIWGPKREPNLLVPTENQGEVMGVHSKVAGLPANQEKRLWK
jgi:hypothetical protein